MSGVFSIASQAALQYLPLVTGHEQTGWPHLVLDCDSILCLLPDFTGFGRAGTIERGLSCAPYGKELKSGRRMLYPDASEPEVAARTILAST